MYVCLVVCASRMFDGGRLLTVLSLSMASAKNTARQRNSIVRSA